MFTRRLFSLALLSALAISCSSPSSSEIDAKPVLTDLTNNVILPTYQRLDESAEVLQKAAHALSDAPSAETLGAAQEAWREARLHWREGEAFRFGPIETNRITAAIDYWPANTGTVEKVIAGSDELTPAYVDGLGANARGFMALEYLLFDNAGGDEAVLAKLTAEGAERRRTYVAALADHLKKKTGELLTAWEPSGGNFARELTDAGSATLFPSGKSAIDQLVNSSAFAADLIVGNKIAKPFGLKSGGVPVPEAEETPTSDNSIADMLSTLHGVESIYTGAYDGKSGKGIGDVVRDKNPTLDQRVLTALFDAKAGIEAIPPPFRTAITEHRDEVQKAYDTTRTLKNLISTEVAGTLGTTLKFNDNDGD